MPPLGYYVTDDVRICSECVHVCHRGIYIPKYVCVQVLVWGSCFMIDDVRELHHVVSRTPVLLPLLSEVVSSSSRFQFSLDLKQGYVHISNSCVDVILYVRTFIEYNYIHTYIRTYVYFVQIRILVLYYRYTVQLAQYVP